MNEQRKTANHGMKSIDYRRKKIKFIEKAPQQILNDVLGILDACVYQDI